VQPLSRDREPPSPRDRLAVHDLTGARRLGGQTLQVRKFTIYPAHAVDVLEGVPLPGAGTHHIRVLLPTEGEGLLLPCEVPYLKNIVRQINKLTVMEGVQDGN
jgi:hypothetical protein